MQEKGVPGVREPDAYGLYPIDREIITLVARGLLYTEIAQELHWGLMTVRVRCKDIYRKLGVSSRAELIQWAWEHL